jgi:dethiobiotin synthetase
MAYKPAETGYFITATDTDMGKTHFAAGLIAELRRRGVCVAPMKPVASGAENIDGRLKNKDALTLIQASGQEFPYEQVNPYVYEPAIAPHIASARNGQEIRLETIEQAREQLANNADMVIVEGVGGWKVPLSGQLDVETVARVLNYPVILVVGLKLGCINHALLSVDAILEGDCRLTGWVANQVDLNFAEIDETIACLIERIPARYLGKLSYQSQSKAVNTAEVAGIVDTLGLQID